MAVRVPSGIMLLAVLENVLLKLLALLVLVVLLLWKWTGETNILAGCLLVVVLPVEVLENLPSTRKLVFQVEDDVESVGDSAADVGSMSSSP